METRKVQQVGFSTLIVSLPRGWVKEVGLKRGDVVTFNREEDGALRVYPGVEREKEELVRCVVNTDLCKEPRLLTRVITAAYLLGRDTIQVQAKGELSPEHLDEIRNTIRRLTGLGIIEQTLKQVVLHNFVDPTKYSIYGMMRRHHIILSSMITATLQALTEQRAELAREALRMEDEGDQLYWLIIRQLFLAFYDKVMAKKIAIEHPQHVLGNRVVAKGLEEMADYAETMAKETLKLLDMNYVPSEKMVTALKEMSDFVHKMSDHTMQAFFTLDVRMANDVIENVEKLEEEREKLTEMILTEEKNVRAAVSLRHLVGSLGQIAKYCVMIAEITINRIMEESNEICRLEVE